jgi:hypothetical protein
MSIILDEIAVQKSRQGVFFIDRFVLKMKRLPTSPVQTIFFLEITPKSPKKQKTPQKIQGAGYF